MAVIIIIAIIIIALIIVNIRVVQQARAFVIERLGAYKETWNVGLHVKMPFIDRVAKIVSLKEQVADYEKELIDQAVARYGSLSKAAEVLGVTKVTLIRKRKR